MDDLSFSITFETVCQCKFNWWDQTGT